LKIKVRKTINDMKHMFDLTTIQSQIKNVSLDVPNLIVSKNASKIVFDKVGFHYTKGQEIFKDLSFEIQSGQKVAIVGASGCGKSTIGRLLYRFYDPIEGRILINNQDIREVYLKSLRRTIGIVPQVSSCPVKKVYI
jgi:ABC-type transport system involved in Fe-S cluster assembly fused permease/ATPase subunit